MSQNEQNVKMLKIKSKHTLKEIFSYLKYTFFLKLIKYNKSLQKTCDIIFEDSIINYHYYIKTKKEEISFIDDTLKKEKCIDETKLKELTQLVHSRDSYYSLGLSFSSKYYLKYSYFFPENINENDKITFVVKYKGFKINDYPLPLNFNKLNGEDKINILEKHEDCFKYTLNNNQMELINLIIDFRKENKISTIIYSKVENLCDYFRMQKMDNEKYLFIYPIGDMKKKILEKDKNIILILLNDCMKNIMILEKGENEYIFIYSDYNKKDNSEIPTNFENNIKLNKNNQFHLTNNINPEINKGINNQHLYLKILNACLNYEGFQIYSLKDDTLIGVLEGPPDTPYENGYFLFKIIFPDDFPIKPPKFIFISVIFHPNISEDGFVSIDIFQKDWTPALINLNLLIYSTQSLLDDPNPDEFLNEKAAKLYKENKSAYNQTVREYTSRFANYKKFQEDLQKLNLKFKTIKSGSEKIVLKEEEN